MTTEQKQIIHRLRSAGRNYQAVASELGITVGAIKTYCFRHALTDKDIENQEQINVCPCCGAEIVQNPKQNPRRFCSDKCRAKWWNNNRDLQKKKVFHPIKCHGCGKEFNSYGNKSRKYCSHACYISQRFGFKETADDITTI